MDFSILDTRTYVVFDGTNWREGIGWDEDKRRWIFKKGVLSSFEPDYDDNFIYGDCFEFAKEKDWGDGE